MKKFSVIILLSIILLFTTGYIFFSFFNFVNNRNKSKQLLQKTYNYLNATNNCETKENGKVKEEDTNVTVEPKPVITDVTAQEIILEDGIIGILCIPKINVNAPILDGTSQEVMKTSIGHFVESDYWNGNVSLASHNGGTNAHYFEELKQLKVDDEIIYTTKKGTRKYKVQRILEISSYDWNYITEKNNENTITLITCVDGKPKARLCVRGVEV